MLHNTLKLRIAITAEEKKNKAQFGSQSQTSAVLIACLSGFSLRFKVW